MKYLKTMLSKKQTPQTLPIPGKAQVRNSAGGYGFAVDDWTRLERFLILGSEGGSYYASERKLTRENADAVVRVMAVDGPRAVERIVEISESGRAPKNDPAIFALAIAASCDNVDTRRTALRALPRVCRIGTHLFHFAEYVDGMRGWGRGLRESIARWYNEMPADKLAHQAIKYQQRDGWSHRDMLRLGHPRPENDQRRDLYHWITQGWPSVGVDPHPDPALRTLWAFEQAKAASKVKQIVDLIVEFDLPREAIPTQWLNDAAVWEALLVRMPMTAMVRNLATMTRVGLLDSYEAVGHVVDTLANGDKLRKARVHPIALLSALKTYAQGHGERGKNTWTPVRQIVDALDGAFYKAFENVEPTGKRWLLGMDVSGSMEGGFIAGVPGLTPRIASAAMALVTAATEKDYRTVAFTSGNGGNWHSSTVLKELTISPRQRLDDVLKTVSSLPFGGTDCALPMIWAREKKVNVDVFVIYTDSETWAGDIHPTQALDQYRQATGIAAKLIVVGMVSNGFTIADPNDAGMLDVVGFDTATPQLMADFAR